MRAWNWGWNWGRPERVHAGWCRCNRNAFPTSRRPVINPPPLSLHTHLKQVKRDGVQRLVVLPLYPQFSISTSGSSLRLLERLFKEDPALRGLKHTVIPSWCVPAQSNRVPSILRA